MKIVEQRDPLPEHFESLEEAAEFWDTRDSADYEDYMRGVECKFDIKLHVYIFSNENESLE